MRGAIIGVLLAVSCAPGVNEVLPPLPPGGAKTLLLLRVPDPLDPASAYGLLLDPEGGRFEWSASNEPFDVALWLADDAVSLGMTGSAFIAHTPDTGGRLPEPVAIFRRAPGEAWTPATTDLPAVRGFRFPYTPGARCLGSDVCFTGDSKGNEGSYCRPECSQKPVIAPPAPPARPRVSCPDGYVVHTSSTGALVPPIESCAGARTPCGPSERSVIGRGCVAIGRACNGSRWPDPPAGSVLWVASDAASGSGDGSQAAPFVLSEALAAARAGDVLALSAGAHRVSGRIDRQPITLYGACTASTRIVGDTALVGIALNIDGATLATGAIRVTGALTLRGAVLRPSTADSLLSGTLTAADALFDTAEGARWVVTGSLDASDVELRGAGLVITGTTARVSATRAVVSGAAPLFQVTGGAALELDTAWVEAERGERLIDLDLGRVDLARARLEGGKFGVYGGVQGGEIHLREVWSRVGAALVYALDESSAPFTLEASDVVVSGGNQGMVFHHTARVRMERVAFEDLIDTVVIMKTSVTSSLEQSSLDISDLTARDVGSVIFAIAGKVALRRARVEAVDSIVISIEPIPIDATTEVRLEDVDVSNVRASVLRAQGNGFYTLKDEQLPTLDVSADRMRIRGARGHALLGGKGFTLMRFKDLSIIDVRPFDPAVSRGGAFCSMYPLYCVGTGFIARPGFAGQLHVDLERFEISGVTAIGIDVESLASVRARSGEVSAGQVGLYYPDGQPDWQDRFVDVAWHAPLRVVLHPE